MQPLTQLSTITRCVLASTSIRIILAFIAALAWCVSLLTFRVLWTWNLDYAFLIWNLALATIPLFFSFLFVRLRNTPVRVLSFFLWLLFLPNAPYIITDFMHLRRITSAPVWFDILLLFSCSITGLAIAFYSISEIHQHFRARNLPRLGWTIVIAVAFLSGFAIYLGRFLRWRSIDIFQQPLALAADTLAFGILFSACYALINFSFSQYRTESQRRAATLTPYAKRNGSVLISIRTPPGA